MSDSDDTDILLLIPPDFFVAESLNSSMKYDIPNVGIIQPIETTPNRGGNQNILANVRSPRMDNRSHRTSPSASCAKKHSTYNNFNTNEVTTKTPTKRSDDNYLREIDNYLAGSPKNGSKLNDINAILLSNGITPLAFGEKRSSALGPNALTQPSAQKSNAKHDAYNSRNDMETNSRRNELESNSKRNEIETNSRRNEVERNTSHLTDSVVRQLDGGRMSDWSLALQQNCAAHQGEQLVNLNQIWGSDKQANTGDIVEEQLRRRQCERQIQNLQNQIKEYQEKFSVAIRIDQTKNEALTRLHETNSK